MHDKDEYLTQARKRKLHWSEHRPYGDLRSIFVDDLMHYNHTITLLVEIFKKELASQRNTEDHKIELYISSALIQTEKFRRMSNVFHIVWQGFLPEAKLKERPFLKEDFPNYHEWLGKSPEVVLLAMLPDFQRTVVELQEAIQKLHDYVMENTDYDSEWDHHHNEIQRNLALMDAILDIVPEYLEEREEK